MKTLFITHHYLSGFGGGFYASRSLILAFAQLSESMTLLCPAREDALPTVHPDGVRVVPVYDTTPRWKKVWNLLTGRLHRFEEAIRGELSRGGYDTVVFDSCYPSFRMIDPAHRAGCRVITVHHNFQQEYVRDNYVFPVRPLMLFWTRRCERAAVRRSDLNLTLTSEDKDLLTHAYCKGYPVSIRVFGIFEPPFAPGTEPSEVEENVFLITGDLGIRQTKASLLEWLKDYYPILKEEYPDCRLILAGKNPHPRIRQFCGENGVELVDTPPEMEPVLKRGKYYICPISLGGGIKLRVMDGLRHGLPVVAHEVSARGYALLEGRYLFAYDSPATFRAALRRLERGDGEADRIVALFRETFTFEAGLGRLRAILQDL